MDHLGALVFNALVVFNEPVTSGHPGADGTVHGSKVGVPGKQGRLGDEVGGGAACMEYLNVCGQELTNPFWASTCSVRGKD